MKSKIKALKGDISKMFYRVSALFKDEKLVDWGSLCFLPDLSVDPSWIPITQDGEVACRRMPLAAVAGIYFETIFGPGADLGTHYHDFYEEVFIAKGELIDMLTGRIYEKGDRIWIQPFEQHRIRGGDQGAHIYVHFARYCPWSDDAFAFKLEEDGE